MNAYGIGYLVGAALMVALLGWLAVAAFRRGTPSGRVVGVVALLLLVGSATSSYRWYSRAQRPAEAEASFATQCLQSCRQQLRDPGQLCEAECRCFAEKLAAYSERELTAWLAAGKNESPADLKRRADIEAAIPQCGREVIGKSFEQLCDEDCGKEGSCPAGFCACMREQLVGHPRFADYQWLSKVALSEEETPQAEAWQREAAARCVPAQK